MSQDRLVYSSDKGSLRKQKPKAQGPLPAPGPTKMRLETKGRGGRAVTVLWHFPWDEEVVKKLIKDLQQIAACGATYKEGRAEFQGDVRPKISAYFAAQGWQLVLAGG